MKRKCGYTEAWFSLSFSFVSLDSFPFPPLKETAAPATQEDSFFNKWYLFERLKSFH